MTQPTILPHLRHHARILRNAGYVIIHRANLRQLHGKHQVDVSGYQQYRDHGGYQQHVRSQLMISIVDLLADHTEFPIDIHQDDINSTVTYTLSLTLLPQHGVLR